MIKGLVSGLIQIAFFAAALLIPAGTWHWPRALQFFSVYGVVLVVSTALMARFAPASLEARTEPPAAKGQPVADRVATPLLLLAITAWLVFIPIDVFRLQIFPPPGLVVSILGALVGLAGFTIAALALVQNAFAVPIVRYQSERGQVVIDTGLYGWVRHPFYLGILVFFAGIALWLESYASLPTLSVILAALAARMLVEEKTLCHELPGYLEYTKTVRHRIVPFIW